MYTKRGGVAAYLIVWIGLCLRSVLGLRVLVSAVDDQWKSACVGINNWVILLRARYKCNHTLHFEVSTFTFSEAWILFLFRDFPSMQIAEILKCKLITRVCNYPACKIYIRPSFGRMQRLLKGYIHSLLENISCRQRFQNNLQASS
jgi:hypothetical protein